MLVQYLPQGRGLTPKLISRAKARSAKERSVCKDGIGCRHYHPESSLLILAKLIPCDPWHAPRRA